MPWSGSDLSLLTSQPFRNCLEEWKRKESVWGPELTFHTTSHCGRCVAALFAPKPADKLNPNESLNVFLKKQSTVYRLSGYKTRKWRWDCWSLICYSANVNFLSRRWTTRAGQHGWLLVGLHCQSYDADLLRSHPADTRAHSAFNKAAFHRHW